MVHFFYKSKVKINDCHFGVGRCAKQKLEKPGKRDGTLPATGDAAIAAKSQVLNLNYGCTDSKK